MSINFTEYYNQLMAEVTLIKNVEKISDTKRLVVYIIKKFKNF
ncbi:hypothetical protein [Spiroplasma kunkelii]|nr:hypothetical protein [Spiroplasma kunkelii]